MVACGRRPILSLSAVNPAFRESLAARCDHHSMRHRFRRHRIARISRLEESVDRRRRFVPCVSSVDLLPILDSARSARLRRCPRRDRKVSAAVVETIDGFCDLALAARSSADQLWPISWRRRQCHRRCLHLAISAHRIRDGCDSDLRAKSALDFSADKNSGRSVHRQHCLQRVPDTETRHPRGRTVLFISQHPAHICAGSCRRGTLRLCHGYSPFFVGRTPVPPTSAPHRSKKNCHIRSGREMEVVTASGVAAVAAATARTRRTRNKIRVSVAGSRTPSWASCKSLCAYLRL